jgi:dihydroorotase
VTVDLLLSNARAYLDNKIKDCSLAIDNGKIAKIGRANMPNADKKVDLKNLLVLPGLIDAHVHLRDEGKARKEDFYSGTAAAAAGGISTVLDMPNNNPVTMSAETVRNRMETAERKVLVNVGLFSEFPRNVKDVRRIAEEGAIGFKLFMAEQVGGLNIDDDSALAEAFKIVSELKMPLAVHAEDKKELQMAESKLKKEGRTDIDAFLEAHSEDVEVEAMRRLLRIAKGSRTHLHFCHVSTAGGLKAIADAKKSRLPVTCESTPHHLFLSADDLRRIGTPALTMPPVRDEHHRLALWNGIKHGTVDIIGSDHAPHTLDEKRAKSVWDVKVGIPGLETTVPLLLTEVKHGRLAMSEIVRLLSEEPAMIFGLKDRGRLRVGNTADFTVVDTNRKYKIDPSKFHSKAKYSPFEGWLVEGMPVKTFVKGNLVMDEGEIIAEAGCGEVIRRTPRK